MYVPSHFAVDADGALELLRSLDAGELVTVGPDGPVATFLPVLFDPTVGDHGALLGHLARNNEQWQSANGSRALFLGTPVDGYVTPSWYAAKAEHGRVVPTWNYVTVHVRGHLMVHDDVEWCRDMVTRLTERHESGRSTPWQVSDAPASYVEGMLRAIVGVELVIDGIEAKVKMSQNRDAADIDGVVAGYGADGRPELAEWVERSRR